MDAAEAQLAERKKDVETAKQKLKECEASEKTALDLVKKAVGFEHSGAFLGL